jgi:hypothetical protein
MEADRPEREKGERAETSKRGKEATGGRPARKK